MELIDRYLDAVGERLHPGRRAGVTAELRSAILDALEARDASLDSEDDVAAVLAELGAPERVAAEYQPNHGYLIGPELYPHFRRAARVALTAVALTSVAGLGASLLLGGLAGLRAGVLLMDALQFAVYAAVVALAVLTGAFAWLQRAEVRLPARPEAAWDPRSLPARDPAARASRFEAMTGLVGAAVAAVVVGGIGQVAREVLPRVEAGLRPLVRDGAGENVLLLQAGLVLSALAHGIAVAYGRWNPLTQAMRMVSDAVAVFVFIRLSMQIIAHRGALLDAGFSPTVVLWLEINAVIVAAVVVMVVAVHWWRAWKRSRTASSGD